MIRHIVWWTLKENADGRTAAENAWHIQQASSMLHGIKSVRSVEVSTRIQPSTTVPVQVILMSSHDDQAALDAYKADPVHVKFAELITQVSNSRNCIDYMVD